VKSTLSTKGQIVVPAELRRQDGIEPGDEMEFERLAPGEYRLRLRTPPNQGLVEWLRSCPEGEWFVPIESESTDSL
jgi:AbrB family looped-hinge helix DNA binding protein